MAQQEYKIDIKNSIFPMLSEQQTRTIIGSTAGEAPGKEDKPHIAYCHNVMPSKQGMDSVGFLSVIPVLSTLPVGLSFSDVRVVYGTEMSRLYIAWDTNGNAYALPKGATAWRALPATIPATSSSTFSIDSITVGTVNGVSYIFFSKIGCFNYNESTNTLDEVTLTGLSIPDILGVVASSGYLVAYTNLAIAWSSTILPTDFVPSQVTGSGGGNVANIAGDIIFTTDNTLGLLIYTAANTVAGTYTGNAAFPFKFREVDNSKGGINLDRVAYEANSKEQFIYSKAGLQAITSQRAENMLPEVTDFLAGRRFEDYNEITNLYEITDLTGTETMVKKIKYIASRYLVISYGLPSTGFTHAIVFDTALKKLGKIRIDHVDVFEYIGAQSEISRESISFLLPTGEVKALNFSVTVPSAGLIILGKLQFVRNRNITLLEVEVENVPTDGTLVVSTQAALKGKAFSVVAGSLKDTDELLRRYNFRSDAKNHSLIFAGQFNLVTAQVTYKVTGKR